MKASEMIFRFSDFGQAFVQSPRAKDPHPADRVGHRLRRRLGDRHACHRLGRQRRIAALHRAVGRPQRAHRFAPRHQPARNFSSGAALRRGSPIAMYASCKPTSKLSRPCRPAARCIPRASCPNRRTRFPSFTASVRPIASSTACALPKGKFFDESDDAASAAVCVLGEGAKVNLLGYGTAVGKFVKVNDTWLEVVGVLNEQLMAGCQHRRPACRISTTSFTFR